MRLTHLKSPTVRNRELPYGEVSYAIESKQFLSEPSSPPSASFFQVVDKRRSRRDFAPLPLDQLCSLLWFSCRTIDIAPPRETRWEHRPSPSAGGRHPIDVFVVESNSNYERLFLYQPVPHALAQLQIDKKYLRKLLDAIDDVLPIQKASVIWFGAQFARTLSRYKHGESLVWKDAGALTAIISLVAESLKLSSCPVGITGEPYFSRCIQSSEVLGVGGVLLGGLT